MLTSQYLEELNDKQKKAVTAPREPLLVLAGPGTGKTRTLIARIIHEITSYKIPPAQILALTFSNKAVQEIKVRLRQVLAEEAEKVRAFTFHSFCLEVLRRYPEKAGLHKHFSVCDEAYQKRLVLELIKRRVRHNPERKVAGVLLAFSNHVLKDKPLPTFSSLIYEDYLAHLEKHKFVDFNLLLKKTLELFSNHEDILEQYRFLNQSVLVDEFQDTDPIQYAIARLLALKHRNIFVVADDDQSIYAWRGAHPENIRQYMQDFNIDKPIILEENYRCSRLIMDAAQTLVQSTDRVHPEKEIHSVRDNQTRIKAFFFRTENEEIKYILKKITDWHRNHGVDYSQIAILYPRHIFGEKLTPFFLKEKIPFQLAAGRNLGDHPVMKRILLYLHLIRDPSDALVLEELVEKELGQHIYKQIQDVQRLNGSTFKKALNDLAAREDISYKLRNQLNTFIGNIANLVNLKSFFTFNRLISEILKGIRELDFSYLQRQAGKIENIEYGKIHCRRDNVNLWIYHSDPALQFIAQQMLEKALKRPVHPLDQEKVIHVKSNDFILFLEPFNLEKVPARYELLFKRHSDRRKGALSELFRWLQAQLVSEENIFQNYVVFDLETTGKNPETCGIVEIAAVKVENGQITSEFQRLVNPEQPIEAGAQSVHHISPQDVADAPTIEQVWPQFMDFIGDALLIAHNGYSFDFKIMDRLSREKGLRRIRNTRYDSLILARNLFPNQQNSIDGLVQRFRLDAGTRHRALDDVRVLHEIFQRLLDINKQMETKAQGEDLAEFVALGNLLENKISATEDRIYFIAGIKKLTSPFSAVRKSYAQKFGIPDEELTQNIQRVRERMNIPGEDLLSQEEFFQRVLTTANEFNHLPVERAIAEFLSFLSLVNAQDNLEQVEAVSLLTFHAAKGLEFDRVIISGMEDQQMPSFFAYKNDQDDDRPVGEKLEEQKRLLYVGITRGKDEVVFTAVQNRFGRQQKSSPFIEEIKSLIEIKSP